MAQPQPEDPRPARERTGAERCSCTTTSLPTPAGGITVLRVAGVVDFATLPVLVTALAGVLDRRPGDLIVDLAGVTFCCVRALSHLMCAHDEAGARDVDYALSGIGPLTQRVMRLLWSVEDLPPVHPTAAGAVIAATARQADPARAARPDMAGARHRLPHGRAILQA